MAAWQFGADATFSKPFDIDDLRTLVMNVLHPSDVPKDFVVPWLDD